MFNKHLKNGLLRRFAASDLTAVFTVGSFGSCTGKADINWDLTHQNKLVELLPFTETDILRNHQDELVESASVMSEMEKSFLMKILAVFLAVLCVESFVIYMLIF